MTAVRCQAAASSAVTAATALMSDASAVGEALQRVERASEETRAEHPSAPHDRVLSELAMAKLLVLGQAVTSLAKAVDAELQQLSKRIAALELSANRARSRSQ